MKKQASMTNQLFRIYTLLFLILFLVTVAVAMVVMVRSINTGIFETQKRVANTITVSIVEVVSRLCVLLAPLLAGKGELWRCAPIIRIHSRQKTELVKRSGMKNLPAPAISGFPVHPVVGQKPYGFRYVSRAIKQK